MEPVPTAGVKPLALLHAITNTPDMLRAVKEWCAETEKKEPSQPVSAPLFLWRLFWAAGHHVHYAETVERLEISFRSARWRMLNSQIRPEPCDVYVMGHEGTLNNIGIVVKSGNGFFLGVDSSIREPYRPVRIENSQVVYFMRCGCRYA